MLVLLEEIDGSNGVNVPNKVIGKVMAQDQQGPGTANECVPKGWEHLEHIFLARNT